MASKRACESLTPDIKRRLIRETTLKIFQASDIPPPLNEFQWRGPWFAGARRERRNPASRLAMLSNDMFKYYFEDLYFRMPSPTITTIDIPKQCRGVVMQIGFLGKIDDTLYFSISPESKPEVYPGVFIACVSRTMPIYIVELEPARHRDFHIPTYRHRAVKIFMINLLGGSRKPGFVVLSNRHHYYNLGPSPGWYLRYVFYTLEGSIYHDESEVRCFCDQPVHIEEMVARYAERATEAFPVVRLKTDAAGVEWANTHLVDNICLRHKPAVDTDSGVSKFHHPIGNGNVVAADARLFPTESRSVFSDDGALVVRHHFRGPAGVNVEIVSSSGGQLHADIHYPTATSNMCSAFFDDGSVGTIWIKGRATISAAVMPKAS
jgi:hypothetical protein